MEKNGYGIWKEQTIWQISSIMIGSNRSSHRKLWGNWDADYRIGYIQELLWCGRESSCLRVCGHWTLFWRSNSLSGVLWTSFLPKNVKEHNLIGDCKRIAPFWRSNIVHIPSNSLIPVDWMIIIDWIPSYNQHLKFPITFRAMIGYHWSLYSKFTKSPALSKYHIHFAASHSIIIPTSFYQKYFKF